MISVIIPAHNEEAVIARTLKAIISGAAIDELEVIVVCNGCSDCTAEIARSFASVRVIETDVASKAHALNLGDAAGTVFPRMYIDADVVISLEAIRMLAERLGKGDVLAVAPMARYEVSGCSWPVRAFYHIRSLLPSAQEGIGGSGVYGLSQAGRGRFGNFPSLTADDGYVRVQFGAAERETVKEAECVVFASRTVRDLLLQKTRAHYGSFELRRHYPELWLNRGEANNRTLLKLLWNPFSWPQVMVYMLITAAARYRAQRRLLRSNVAWERDNSSRELA